MNTTIAKLLAKEDVIVQTGAYSTAWFDIKNRTLGLPDWKDMGKDVKDLLIGHEVGHALYTPFEGWHDSPEKLEGCPRSYINVVEDCRIEKKIKRDYPGLIGPMSRGYKKLVADEFFGDVDSIDWDKVKLIDKINLKAKIGNLLDVPMSDVELSFYNKSMQTEEFSEVLDVVREILAWTQENQEELIQKPETAEDDFDEEESENEDPTQNMGHDDYEDEEENKKEENTQGNSNPGDEELDDEETDEGSLKTALPEHTDEDISVTDSIFRAMEKTLLPESTEFVYANEISKEVFKKVVFKYDQLAKLRINQKILENQYGCYNNSIGPFYKADSEEKFKAYMKRVKKAIVPAVKEFEQKKAAHQWMHATTAKTGRIDVNKLHSYRVSEDIFAKTTKMANSKNHGMFMIIDYSGSMFDSLNNVLDQLIHSVMFCKAVNIPFDVYAFTSGNNVNELYRDGDLYMDSLSMPQLIHSGLTKSKFEEALKHIFSRMAQCNGPYDRWSRAECEDFGSTPLNQALIVSHKLVREFKKKFGIEKVTFLTITDGDTNRLSVMQSHKIDRIPQERNYNPKHKVEIDGRSVILKDARTGGTKDLLDNLKKRYGVQTMGFFIADHRNDFNHAISKAHFDGNDDMWWSNEFTQAKKKYFAEHKKQKCVHFKDSMGYNNWYVVKNDTFKADEDNEIEADSDMTKGQVLRAFKKFSNNKKNNKNLMSKFGQAVA